MEAANGTKRYEMDLVGRPLVAEIGQVAGQANGSVLMHYGDTVVLVTACASDEPREGVNFFPLTVDYEERLYAVGRIPGGFIKREGKPSESAILSARLTDRPLRPLFPKGFRNDVQVIATVLSVEQDCSPEITAMLGASLALMISDIPFEGPVGAVAVGLVDGKLVINPTAEENEKSDLDLVVAGTKDAILMVEAGAREVPEDTILDAIDLAHKYIKELVSFQERITEEVGKEKREFPVEEVDEEIIARVKEEIWDRLDEILPNDHKQSREKSLKLLEEEVTAKLLEVYPEGEMHIIEAFGLVLKDKVREMIIQKGIRPDGRGFDEIRPLSSEVSVLPRTHGSGLFTRGETQVLTVATLGAASDVQIIDDLGLEEAKRYMHHYNFPPYSTGEVRPLRGPKRREIGHGALAERALLAVLPSKEEFPYTTRLVSEVLSSNGSTSMASVCGSTLALMDAGVPIKKPVAGIAMGLVKDGDNVFILTDIQGMEDALGDMDFKVAGTRDGITALQMDIKIKGITREIMKQALEKAKRARLIVLDNMAQAISGPRKELSPYAPRIITVKVDPDKIRYVIGPGGKMINKIISETDSTIDIEPDGTISIAANDEEKAAKAKDMILSLTQDVEVGKTYLGRVTRTEKYGAFVEVLPGKEGLCHISELDEGRVNRVEDVCHVGDQLLVKVTDIDSLGRINLSHREALKSLGGGKRVRVNRRRQDRRKR